jgi:hypothetical protein
MSWVSIVSFRKLVVSFAQACACVVAFSAAPAGASAATLEDYYRTMMTIRACEMVITEEDWDRLTSAIEDRISNTDTSSESVNGIFQQVGNEMRDNLEAYCADNTAAATAVLADLPYWNQ